MRAEGEHDVFRCDRGLCSRDYRVGREHCIVRLRKPKRPSGALPLREWPTKREGRRSRPLQVWKEKLDVSRATRAYLPESSLQAYSAEASRTVNQPKFAGTSKLPPASAVCNAPALGCAASMTKANTP